MQIRFYAGAADAAGRDVMDMDASGLTAQQALSRLGADNDALARVLAASSLLADGVRVTDRATGLAGVEQLDVLPPFAGG